MHSGFEAPTIGEIIPPDYIRVDNPDGTISFFPPEETAKMMEKDEQKGIKAGDPNVAEKA